MFRPVTWSGRPALWLRITAWFELALAAVFVVLGFTIPVASGGMFLTAAILGGVGILLLLWGNRMKRGYEDAQRIKTTGIPGQAQIVGMRQTGVYLNEQPQIELQLQVTTETQGTYQATVKEYVPLMMLGRLSTGQPLPVKVDPANPQNVVIEWESAMGGMPGGVPPVGPGATPEQLAAAAALSANVKPGDTTHMGHGAREEAKKRLLATGVTGKGTVLAAQATGQTDDEGRPVYNLTMRIEVPGRQPMQGPAVTGVPPEHVAMVEAGDQIVIKANPSNPSEMTIDWDATGKGSA